MPQLRTSTPVEYATLRNLAPDNVDRREPGADLSAALLRLFWERRRWLASSALIGLAAGILCALVLPRRYVSVVKLMPPSTRPGQGTSALAELLAKSGGGMPGMLGNLLGTDGSGALFVGILESRTIQNRLVERFDLKNVYWDRLQEDACKDLAKRTGISEDRKSGILTITVSDSRPGRAAAIGQAYVEELDRLSAELSTSAARRERIFLEERLRAVKLDLDEASRDLSRFASQNGAIDLSVQGRTMLEGAARLQGDLSAAQTERKGLEQTYTGNNVRVRSLDARITELQKQLAQLGSMPAGPESGAGESAPSGYPSMRQIPLVWAKYADLFRRRRIQEALYETLTQQYELAKVQEAKETPSVKVLDQASVPQRKSFPPGFAVVLLFTSAGLGEGIAWLTVQAWWRRIEASNPRKVLAQEILDSIRPALAWRSAWTAPNALTHRIWARFSRNSAKYPA